MEKKRKLYLRACKPWAFKSYYSYGSTKKHAVPLKVAMSHHNCITKYTLGAATEVPHIAMYIERFLKRT